MAKKYCGWTGCDSHGDRRTRARWQAFGFTRGAGVPMSRPQAEVEMLSSCALLILRSRTSSVFPFNFPSATGI